MTEGTPDGIPACLRCGSTRLHMPGLADGGSVGTGIEFSDKACDECGWRGVPVTFDDEEALEAFRATLTDAEST